MKANRISSLTTFLAALISSIQLLPARAADKTDLPGAQLRGDKIKLIAPGSTFKLGETTLCAPAGTEMRITDVNADQLSVVITDGPAAPKSSGNKKDTELLSKFKCSGTPLVEIDGSYTVNAADFKAMLKRRKGFTYGAMVVPFKFYLKDRKFESSQSLGMYFGWREAPYDWMGLSFVGSAGIANFKATNKTTGGSSNVLGYTFAGGVLFDLTKETRPFVAGLLIGRDYYGKDPLLPDIPRAKTWLSLQLGFEI